MFEELKLNENVGAPQPDALAQIARKDDFLQQLQEFLAQHKGENWCVSAIDIEHFKLYTELYGSQQAHSLMLSLQPFCWSTARRPVLRWATLAATILCSACRMTKNSSWPSSASCRPA